MKTLGEWLDEQKEPEPTRDELIEQVTNLEHWLYRNGAYQDATILRHVLLVLKGEA